MLQLALGRVRGSHGSLERVHRSRVDVRQFLSRRGVANRTVMVLVRTSCCGYRLLAIESVQRLKLVFQVPDANILGIFRMGLRHEIVNLSLPRLVVVRLHIFSVRVNLSQLTCDLLGMTAPGAHGM